MCASKFSLGEGTPGYLLITSVGECLLSTPLPLKQNKLNVIRCADVVLVDLI